MKNLPFRIGLPGLLLLLAVLGVLACAQQEPDRPPTATTGVAAPTAAVASSESPDASESPAATPAAAAQDPTGLPTVAPADSAPAPTATVPATPRAQPAGQGASLVLLRSRSVAAPTGTGFGGSGGFSLSPAPQTMAAAGSLTVSAIGSVTVAADEAYVVVIPQMDYGPSGPEQLSDRDRDEIMANLSSIGVSEDSVEFESFRRYEPTTISVEVGVSEVAELGDSIVTQVEEVVRRSESFGVRFTLSEENCRQAVSLARREAVPSAEVAADDLADALGVMRGAVNGALEYPLQTPGYWPGGASHDLCGGQDDFPFGILLPFDSVPEVEVSVGLQVSYDLR